MRAAGTRVLVTGAGGFIGSHLVETLANRGAAVTALVHYDARADLSNLEHVRPEVLRQIEVVSGNIEDAFFMARLVKGQTFVFHLAALIPIPYSYLAPASYVRTNVEGTVNVLEASRLQGVGRVVNVSTSETYGSALYTPIDEKHPQQAQSPYAASKIGAERLAESFARSFDLPVVNVRPFNTYGPRQSARAVIPAIIAQALTSPEIRLGIRSTVRDFTFVADTVDGLIAAAEADGLNGQTINLGSGEGRTIDAIVALVQEITGTRKPIVCEPERQRPTSSEVAQLICDATAARQATGWVPQVSFREGLERTVEFVRRNPGSFRPEIYAR